jgi:hypothetical protein
MIAIKTIIGGRLCIHRERCAVGHNLPLRTAQEVQRAVGVESGAMLVE